MNILKILWILLLTFLLLSCNNPEHWDAITIDPNISQDSVYKRMDTEEEIFSAHETDTLRKKSSDVEYIDKYVPNKLPKNNNCRAYFHKSDTLIINIGIGTGFGGSGFIIKYKSSKFYTEPYYITDVIMEQEADPTYKLIYQKLILNKSDYKVGDSLFGNIDFKSIGPNFSGIEHSGRGYFRAKIKPVHKIKSS